jgi:hypothetical protein
MPNKSPHGKKKRSTLSKRRRDKQRPLAVSGRQPVASEIPRAAATTSEIDSQATASAQSPTPATGQYAYVIADLKRIGIPTGIILVIAIVLAVVLR